MTPKTLASCLRRAPAAGFAYGYTPVTGSNAGQEGWNATSGRVGPTTKAAKAQDRVFNTGMSFGVLRLRRGETLTATTDQETLWVLMSGRCRVALAGQTATVARASLFDEGPYAVHAGTEEQITFKAETVTEWAVTRTPNPRRIGARLYRNDEFTTEDRGAGLAQGACRRLVRTIFDYSTRPDSNLVVGEVVNFPGRWSTYPPHHHPQPEIYHYRFTEPQGYGHCEIGDDVVKVRGGDTALIPGGLDHSQVSAPGYGMYYLWVIRHLPGTPYRGFEFTPEHKWLLDPLQQGWVPQVPSADQRVRRSRSTSSSSASPSSPNPSSASPSPASPSSASSSSSRPPSKP